MLVFTLFRRTLHLTHLIRVRVRLVSVLSDAVLKGFRLVLTASAGLRTPDLTRSDGVWLSAGFGAILRNLELGEGSPWLLGLSSKVPVVVELESWAVANP
jgi:hypothetical protein